MKMTSIILVLLMSLMFIGCQLDPTTVNGEDGTDGTDGVDGTQGIPGEDGQDLTYKNYEAYDNSGDYLGIAYITSYDYPYQSVTVKTLNGYWVYVSTNYYSDYYPAFGYLVVKTSDGKTYALSLEINWQGATASGPINEWYTYVSEQKYLGYDLDIVSYAYYHDDMWAGIGTSTHFYDYTYMEVSSTTLTEIGLPAYDPPFTYVEVQ